MDDYFIRDILAGSIQNAIWSWDCPLPSLSILISTGQAYGKLSSLKRSWCDWVFPQKCDNPFIRKTTTTVSIQEWAEKMSLKAIIF